MTFEPIAVVGRGCVLPGARGPGELWDIVADASSVIDGIPADRWRLGTVAGGGGGPTGPARPVGGTVPTTPAEPDLDPIFDWVLDTARTALDESGQAHRAARTGLISGTLGYPTEGATALAEHVLAATSGPLARQRMTVLPRSAPQARNRFFAGLPAQYAAATLGLGAGAFTLDAACASSLYAIKLACDRLHDRRADVMVAGGVNRADNLVVYEALRRLSALSPTGRSRPFHRLADGLVPSEGAAYVALMRLADALAADAPVFGVIRAVGLSNDGRSRGLLVPAEVAQAEAMRAAYRMSGLDPASVSLVECHATGTAVGDATEARTMARVFADSPGLTVGSVKANLGHPLAAAGAVGLVKVLEAMRAGVRPPHRDSADPIAELSGTPLRLLAEAEEWTGPRRAAVNAFGFGGANGHLVVDHRPEPVGRRSVVANRVPAVPGAVARDRVVVTALAVRAGGGDTADFRTAVLTGRPLRGRRTSVRMAPGDLRFPPKDMAAALPQQTLLADAAREVAAHTRLPRGTAVVVGSGAPVEAADDVVVRRLRSRDVEGADAHRAWWARASREAGGEAGVARVLGTLPNVVANRINSQLDLHGPGLAIFAEQASGLVALDCAARWVADAEVDAALVCAVDDTHEPAHRRAAAQLGLPDDPAQVAVVLVLKRERDARRAGDRILAVLAGDEPAGPADLLIGDRDDERGGATPFDPASLVGRAHAASGLVSVAVAVLCLADRVTPRVAGRARPAPALDTAQVTSVPMLGSPYRCRLRRLPLSGPATSAGLPRLYVYSGRDRDEVRAALAERRESVAGPARLAIVAGDAAEADALRLAAEEWLRTGAAVPPPGVLFRERPLSGQVAFTFASGSTAYPGMAGELVEVFPEVLTDAVETWGAGGTAVGLAPVPTADPGGRTGRRAGPSGALARIIGSAVLATAHVRLTRDLLGVTPDAALGFCSGEMSAVAALGLWADPAGLVDDCVTDGLFDREIGGEHRVLRRAWGDTGRWASFQVNGDVGAVRRRLAGLGPVHLMVVQAPGLCVVGGEERACLAALEAMDDISWVRLDYDVAAHVPELEPARARIAALHRRETVPAPPDLRLYSGRSATRYGASAEEIAEALADQTVGPVDYPAVVRRAWDDGVRIFVEHGPKDLCTKWVRRILADRDVVAVALDTSAGDLRSLVRAAAELLVAGVPVDTRPLRRRSGLPPLPLGGGGTVVIPLPSAHLALPEPSAGPADGQWMAPAPPLPSARTAVRHGPVADRGRAGRAGPADPGTSTGRETYDRAALETHAAGRLADVLGPAFADHDDYRRRTRIPAPPVLLVDRVTAVEVDAVPADGGRLESETDLRPDTWFLDGAGRIPPALMIEAGHADLFLLSRLGIDRRHRGSRSYRLLGCEVTYHGAPGALGDTLRYGIEVRPGAEVAGTQLVSFSYDCFVGDELRLTLREGQAGYFTDRELAGSAGIAWSGAGRELPAGHLAVPPTSATGGEFDAKSLQHFAEGRADRCFGTAWAPRTGRRTPVLSTGRLLMLDQVTAFDPGGGAWRRGHLRAETPIRPDDWFFAAHFVDDPCMPGTFMLEGGYQAAAFYLGAAGQTIGRDDWCFAPTPGVTTLLRCRRQVTPANQALVYELHVSRLVGGPVPTVTADLVCTVDGVPAFTARDLSVSLRPARPARDGAAGADDPILRKGQQA